VLAVVVLGDLDGEGALLEGHDAVALALDAAEDLSDEAAGDAVGLDQDKGALGHENLLRITDAPDAGAP
jgi:hypothetical protein